MTSNNNQQSTTRVHYDSSRRRLLQLLGISGAGMIAGCNGDDGDSDRGDRDLHNISGQDDTTESVENLDHVNQEFRLPMARPIEEVNFFHVDKHGFWEWEYHTNEHPIWGRWVHSDYLGQGEVHLRQFEEMETEDDRVEFTVRDDVTWSNGEQKLGRDVILPPIEQRVSAAAMPFDQVEEQGPSMPWDAITDYEYDGRSGTLYGDFENVIDQNIWLYLFVEHNSRYPTTVEPWKEYADRIFEMMDLATSGEIDPWSYDGPSLRKEIRNDVYGEPGSDQREALHERFRDPDEVIVDGAWTLEEIRGDQAIWLEPNQEHRNADLINFDRLVLEAQGEDRVIHNLLKTGEYDMAQAEPPSHIAEEFASIYDEYLAVDNNGESIVLNHSHEPLGNVRVRQALMAALDNEVLCQAMDPVTWEPVKSPGADNPARPNFLEDTWYEENLQNYEHDPEFAAELMREGGFERDSNGTWVDSDSGDSVELTVYTSNGAPELEPTIEKQLDEFGVKANYATLENTTLQDNLDSGQIPMWTGDQNAGSAYTMVTCWTFMTWQKDHMHQVQWFDGSVEENIEKTPWDEDGYIASNDPEELDHLTIQAPPVGEFYGDLQEYPVVSMTYRFENGKKEDVEELWPQLMWLNNWYLPALPIANRYKQFYLNTENWNWTTDHNVWDYLAVTTRLMPEDLHSWGDMIFADPENPK